MGEDNTITTINPGDEHWSTSYINDDTPADRSEALKGFESFDAFYDAHDALKNTDFRAAIAGDDDKFLSSLQRYNTPADLGNAFREQRQMISAGNLQKPLGEDATDEDIKVYRENNGIPLEAVGYMNNLPEGLVVGDDDKEIMQDFMGALHSKNADPAIAHAAIEWYNGFAEAQQDAQAELDTQQSTEANDTLRTDWGADYRANINLVNGLIASTFGQEAADQLLNGRFQDGRAFMNDPNVLKGFAQIARTINPIMEISEPGTDPTTTLNDEIASLEKYMREDRTKYNNDVKAQERLLQLYDIRLKHKAA